MITSGIIKKRVAEALNRDDLDTYAETWLSQAHRELQDQRDWDAMTFVGTVFAESDAILWVPKDFKSAYGPKTGSRTGPSGDMTEVAWYIDYNKFYLDSPPVQPGDMFTISYYRYLGLPAEDETDWFIETGQGYLLYESLIQAVPFLGGADDRAVAWTLARDRSLQWLVAADVERRYGGRSLVMRG